MSQHEVKVVRIDRIEPHGNADTLEVVHVWGYTSCVRIGDFKVGDLAAFLEPDTLIPSDVSEVAFLAGEAKVQWTGPDKDYQKAMIRIKAKRLRGVQSFGLLIKARPTWSEGDDVFSDLGCDHYEPPIRGANTGGDNEGAPSVYHVKYDVEPMRKFSNVIQEGEVVEITEKIHGANARYVFHDGRIYCGSHTNWKKEDLNNLWWRGAQEHQLSERLAAFPDHVFYAEIYGQVQDLRYGTAPGEVRLAFFDIMFLGRWLSVEEVRFVLGELQLPPVPQLFVGPWSSGLANLADGRSIVPGADHIREGCVVKPVEPRWDYNCGRVILKLVSVDYLSQKTKKSKEV